jgi:hypothetical protein
MQHLGDARNPRPPGPDLRSASVVDHAINVQDPAAGGGVR